MKEHWGVMVQQDKGVRHKECEDARGVRALRGKDTDVSKIVTTVNVTLVLTIMLSMQSDQIRHWSHLSDLPSQCVPTAHHHL